jgi:DNA replication and repair protein RecF
LRLVTIQVSNVRNLVGQEIRPGEGLNLLAGSNGQGKSSVLEAVYLLGTTRSFRTARLSEVVTAGSREPALVSGEGETPGERLAVSIARAERKYARHGKIVPPSDYIGTLDVVALSNDIVHGFRRHPAERRRFLDRMALATWPSYLDELHRLRRACEQRALLVASGGSRADRGAWDERAADLAVPVTRRRFAMAAALEEGLRSVSPELFPEGASARVRYVTRPAWEPGAGEGAVAGVGESPGQAARPGFDADRYRVRLAALFAAQESAGGRGRRETPGGPLRDDLAIDIDGRDVLKLGSAGQVRSLLTAAVLAELRRLASIKGRFPVLVLDDVDADLDESRYGALLAGLAEGAQVFAATSKPGLAAGRWGAGKRFHVSGGVVAEA